MPKTSDDVMEEFENFLSTQDDLRDSARNHILALVECIQYLAMEEGQRLGMREAMMDVPYGGCL